ncbi:MAG: endonuclease domain-containing protein [Bacteroidales bacterium]
MSENKKFLKSKYQMYLRANKNIQLRAKALRKKETEAEKLLWSRFNNRQFKGLKFRRQHPLDIFIADFYCHEKRLVIEVDGKNHDSDNIREYDQSRTSELENSGIKVIRFLNEEIIEDLNMVMEKIGLYIEEMDNS